MAVDAQKNSDADLMARPRILKRGWKQKQVSPPPHSSLKPYLTPRPGALLDLSTSAVPHPTQPTPLHLPAMRVRQRVRRNVPLVHMERPRGDTRVRGRDSTAGARATAERARPRVGTRGRRAGGRRCRACRSRWT
ncbi:hypothetical protein EVG20_g9721 [Dentipellis fragilis]|uniref:Uncharacterized protein n=1 Tax=Dentipellis fragilis TaxID=205917 RepID=A0A4Y9XW83_9AGAM|nr:hypothetical protein EVG20_g9721 [Dentipellis fragilis]